MYHTWFFMKRLAEAINEEIKGSELVECYSQNKDELLIAFANESFEFWIKADLGEFGLLSFPESFSRARKNSVNLFAELIGSKVERCSSFQHERSFSIFFSSGHSMIFKMHGSRSNILLERNDNILSFFRSKLRNDKAIVPSELHNESMLEDELIRKLMGRKNQRLLPALSDTNRQQLINGDFHVGWINSLPTLSLFPIDEEVLITSNAIEASNKFSELHYRTLSMERERAEILKHLEKRKKQALSYLSKTSRKLDEIKTARSPEEIGHLIMANLHSLMSGIKEAVLDDLYGEGTVSIRLNPKLSPQKNAENYYRKAKNRKIEVSVLEKNLEAKRKELDALESEIGEVMQMDEVKALRKWNTPEKSGSSRTDVPLPYHQFELDGWQILVGKNAKSNDQLTLKVASKNDLWLHARDVSGSHVVVRERAGHEIPKHVLEKAAGLAAWYSKRKTDSLCPVIYTPRKFVRKVKGAPAGQVVVDREEVVMIEPNKTI